MKPYIVQTIFLILYCSFSKSHGQTLEETRAYGDLLFEQGEYQEAVQVYRRYLFFARLEARLEARQGDVVIFQKLSKAYELRRNFDKAVYFNNLATELTNAPQKAQQLLRTAYLYLISNQFDLAFLWLLNLPDEEISPSWQQQKELYTAISEFKRAHYKQAESHFYAAADSEVDSLRINTYFHQLKRMQKRMKPNKSRLLSIILPGLGQISSGYLKEGINSFAINAGFMVLFSITANKLSLLDAILSVTPWHQKYYAGGFNRAAELTQQKLTEKEQEVYRELVSIFIK